MIDRYRPDMLYFDNHDLPLQQAGLDMAAYFYNRNMEWSGGMLEGVVTAQETPPQRRMGLVGVLERGQDSYIDQFPWQTETCLGNWFYGEQFYREIQYKTAAKVLHTLCDVVSKNGNLMLSVPIRGDGTIDDKEQRIVEEIAVWLGRYGEAIYSTRPWRIHGEGLPGGSGGAFSEGAADTAYTSRDIRYVTRDDALRALVLGCPADDTVRLTLLGRPVSSAGARSVGSPGPGSTPLPFTRSAEVLEARVPAALRNSIGIALIVDGAGLTG